MNGRRTEERLYTAVLVAFLACLLALGLLGVPALLVAAAGAAAAALGIALFHRFLQGRSGTVGGRRTGRAPLPDRYVPSILEASTMRRRRLGFPRRHRHASPPLRLH